MSGGMAGGPHAPFESPRLESSSETPNLRMLHAPFDSLESTSERVSRLGKLFAAIDADGDGYLDKQELLQRFTEMAMSGREQGEAYSKVSKMAGNAMTLAQNLLQKSDKDGDGMISFDEFVEFITEQEKHLYGLFCRLDRSGDGHLESSEVLAACEAEGFQASADVINRFVKNLSTDGDHQISYLEFRSAFELNPNAVEFLGLLNYYQTVFEPAVGFDMIVLPQQQSAAGLSKWIAASAMSGIMSRTVNAPLERIRVYLQLGGGDNRVSGHPLQMFSRGGRARMAQMFKESLNVISRDGGLVSGLWRGNLVHCLRVIPEAAVRMLAITKTRVLMVTIEKPADGATISHIPGKFAAGAAGAFTATTVIYPFDVVQTRMMAVLDRTKKSTVVSTPEPVMATPPQPAAARAYSTAAVTSSPQAHNIIRETVSEMWKDGGIKSFYRGLVPTLIGIIPYAGTNIATFEFLKLQYLNLAAPSDPRRPSLWSILGLGCISGSVAEVITYPISVVKSRMQSAGTQFNPDTYRNTLDCVSKVYRSHGPAGFYRGLTPTLLKAAPGVGVGFTCLEISKRVLGL